MPPRFPQQQNCEPAFDSLSPKSFTPNLFRVSSAGTYRTQNKAGMGEADWSKPVSSPPLADFPAPRDTAVPNERTLSGALVLRPLSVQVPRHKKCKGPPSCSQDTEIFPLVWHLSVPQPSPNHQCSGTRLRPLLGSAWASTTHGPRIHITGLGTD